MDEVVVLMPMCPLHSPRTCVLRRRDATYAGDQQLNSEFETHSTTQTDDQGLETSSMTLKFTIAARHFARGLMRLKCTATTGRAYVLRAEVVASAAPDEQEMSRLQRVSENLNQGA